MFKKRIKFNTLFLTGILIYAAFIGLLYIRMKHADKMLRDYSNAQTCIVTSNCRETIYVEVLDYGSSKMSFENYGPKGMPMGTTTFEDYTFVVLGDGLNKTTLKVLSGLSFDLEKFDIANVYLPSEADSKITNKDFLIGKK